jgi:hypothetical protein
MGGRAAELTVESREQSQMPRRPYPVHFTPTSASWINQVERWFAELTRKRLRRGVHTSVRRLQADIHAFIDPHNQNPTPGTSFASMKAISWSRPTSKKMWRKAPPFLTRK